MEWDLKGVKHTLDSTWKDEALMAVWMFGTVAMFIPPLQPYIKSGFEVMRAADPLAPTVFLFGWGIILSATFGMKMAIQFLYPNRAATLVQSMGATPDVVPMTAVRTANEMINNSDPSSGIN